MGIESVKNHTSSYQRASENVDVKLDSVGASAGAQRAATELSGKAAVSEAAAPKTNAETEEPTVPQAVNNEQIKKVVNEINRKNGNSEAIFGIHDATNRVTIKIIDKDTKEVLKEFPPEKTLDMIAKAWEMAGIMVDEKR